MERRRTPIDESIDHIIYHTQGCCDHSFDNVCYACETPWHQETFGRPPGGSQLPMRLDRKDRFDEVAPRVGSPPT